MLLLSLSTKYRPLGDSAIDHLFLQPIVPLKYLLPSTLYPLLISIGTPSDAGICTLELNKILLIPVSWKQYISLLKVLRAFTLPLLPSRSRVLAIVMLAHVSTSSASTFSLDQVTVFGNVLRL